MMNNVIDRFIRATWRAGKFVVTFILLLCSLTGCSHRPIYKQEQPHLYWKDIDVTVENIDNVGWFAGVPRYRTRLTVYSEEYQLTYTDEFVGSGAFGKPGQCDYKQGDIVKAELYSWVMDSTDEVIERKINRVY